MWIFIIYLTVDYRVHAVLIVSELMFFIIEICWPITILLISKINVNIYIFDNNDIVVNLFFFFIETNKKINENL